MTQPQPHSLPLGQWLWEADGICLEEVNAERALGLPPIADPTTATDAEMPAAAQYGRGLIPALQTKLERLEALGLPDDPIMSIVAQVTMEHYRQNVAAFAQAQEAALRGDSKGFRQSWMTGRAHDYIADSLFERLGCDLCAND